MEGEAVPTEEGGTQKFPEETSGKELTTQKEQAKAPTSNLGLLAAIGLIPFNWKFILILVIIIGLVLVMMWFIGKKKKKG